ncbi:MAG: hypothetical protein EHM85_01380 [Desulfobacteraceae bacterium]|nr:MAG: hypothetical protein EHM85_01380 [Desulfobacteraceae bacterium]
MENKYNSQLYDEIAPQGMGDIYKTAITTYIPKTIRTATAVGLVALLPTMLLASGCKHVGVKPGEISQEEALKNLSGESQGGGGGGGGGGCFTPNTPVLMSDDKTKPIKQIQIGDEVKSFDFEKNKATTSKVIALFKFKKTEHLIINGLEVTKTHPFCIGKGLWKEAGMLKVGDVLIGEGNSEIKIERIEKVQKDVAVHNFTVDGTHNYFVSNGEKNFLVHNKGGSS